MSDTYVSYDDLPKDPLVDPLAAEKKGGISNPQNANSPSSDVETVKPKIASIYYQDTQASLKGGNSILSPTGMSMGKVSGDAKSASSKDHLINTNWSEDDVDKLLAGQWTEDRFKSRLEAAPDLPGQLQSIAAAKEKEDDEKDAIVTKGLKKSSESSGGIGGFFKKVWNWLTGKKSEKASQKDDDVDELGNTPSLEAPNPIDQRHFELYVGDMKKLNERNEELLLEVNKAMQSGNSHYAQALIEKLTKGVYEALIGQRMEAQQIKGQAIMNIQRQNEKLMEEEFKLNKEINSLNTASHVLGWVDFGLAAAITAVTIIGFATGGLGFIGGIAVGAAGVAAGAATISKGAVDYVGNLDAGKTFALQELQKEHDRVVKKNMEDYKRAMESVPNSLWGGLKNVVDSLHEAARWSR